MTLRRVAFAAWLVGMTALLALALAEPVDAGTVRRRAPQVASRGGGAPEPWPNVSGVRRQSGASAWLSRTVDLGSDLDMPRLTVCFWAIAPNVDYESAVYRASFTPVPGAEPFWVGGNPVPAYAPARTWAAGFHTQGYGIYADIAYYDEMGAPHSVCIRYAPASPVGDASIWIDGVDRTVRDGDGAAVPVFPGQLVPPALVPSSLPLNVANLRGGAGGAAVDSLAIYDDALSPAEIMRYHCATQTTRGPECDGVSGANASTAVFGHPDLVDFWAFDDADPGLSYFGTHNLDGAANVESTDPLP